MPVTAFERAGAGVTTDGQVLHVTGLTPEDAGEIAFSVQQPIYELASDAPTLEQLFFELAAGSDA